MATRGGVEEVGVKAIVEGTAAFIKQMASMEKAYDKMTGAITKGSTAVESMGATAAGGPTAALIALGVAAGQLAATLITKLLSAIKDVTVGLFNLGKTALTTAGLFKEAELTALAIGRAMGLTKNEILGAIAAVKEVGIRSDIAAKTVASFARNQLDLADATKIAAIAQATGIIVNKDSSETMQDLITAIATGSAVRLKTLQIIFDTADAEARYAKEIGKSADALTQVEKQQARVNEIIRQGIPLVDVYGAAMQSATKQMRTLSGRLLPELLAALGAPFQDAFFTVVKSVNNLVEAFTAAISEGGNLFPVMVKLGAIASILADAFRNAVIVVINFINELDERMTSGLSGIAESALRWGANIVAQLAKGMAAAIQSFLIPVINFLGSVLRFFFGPGSPPRVAPDIDEWGAAAMTEYLRGFSEADFTVLEKIQGLLKSVLSGREFAALSETLIGGLAGGQVGEDFFQTVARQAGAFGDEIAALVRLQLDYAAATEDATQAQLDLERAQRSLSTSQADISRATREFNELLRAGASREALAAKRAEIDAAEERFELSKDESQAAQQELQDAKDRRDALKTEATLQEKLVQQLLKLAEARTEAAGGGGGGGGGAGGAGGGLDDLLGGLELPTPSDFGFGDTLTEMLNQAKADILAKFTGEGGIFQPLITAWNENLKPALEGLLTAFEPLATWFNETLPMAVGDFKESLEPELSTVMKTVKQFIDGPLKRVFRAWFNAVEALTKAIAEGLHVAIKNLTDYLGIDATGIWETFIAGALINFRIQVGLLGEGLESVANFLDRIANILRNNDIWRLLFVPGAFVGELLDPENNPPEEQGDVGEGVGAAVDALTERISVDLQQPGGVNVYVNVGEISNGMDLAELEVLIVHTVERAVGG